MNAALRYRVARDLRARWRPMLAIALLLGVAGGISLAAAAGARRTASAYDRMLADSHPSDVLVNPDLGDDSKVTPEMIAALPMVQKMASVPFLMIASRNARTVDDLQSFPAAPASVDGVLAYDLDRPNLLAGRMPDPTRADEVYLNKQAADRSHLHVGSRIDVLITSPAKSEAAGARSDSDIVKLVRGGTLGERVSFTVTGIGVNADEIVVDEGFEFPAMVLTPAFYRTHSADRVGYWGAYVKLRNAANDLQPFRKAVQDIADRYHEGIAFKTASTTRQATLRAIRPQSVALAIFAAIVGVAGLLLGAQALARRLFIDAREYPAMLSLGLTGRDLFVGSMLGVLLVSVAGWLLAAALAFVASGRFPVGPARLAEPSAGLDVDWFMFVAAALVVVLIVPALVAWPAWRLARGRVRERTVRPSRIAGVFARSGSSPAILTGVRHAFERGHGRAAVPVVTTFVAAIGAMAAVVAALTFAASLDHLAQTPRLYGWNWDRMISVDGGELDETKFDAVYALAKKATASALNTSPDAEGWSLFAEGPLTLNGRSVQSVGVEPGGGLAVVPTVANGRAPLRDREIALGRRTMQQLGVANGDTVRATYKGDATRLRVVGQAVLPALGFYPGQDKTTIGDGAVVTRVTLQKFAPPFPSLETVVRFTPHGSESALVAAVKSGVQRAVGREFPDFAKDVSIVVQSPRRPTDVGNYERIRATPLWLAAALALLAGAAVAHALVTAIRTRRRELAILRCEGFTRGQVVGSVAVHASTIALVSAALGIPLGIALGRFAWTALADSIGAVAAPVVPLWLLLLVPAVLIVANVVAIPPARRAARVVPAVALRSE